MPPDPEHHLRDAADWQPHPHDQVRIQAVTCGRCGWPNACRVQDGMRCLRFLCRWCNQLTTGIVDPSIKSTIIF